jgi:hypothetical protein
VTDEAVGAYVVQLTSSTHDDGALYRPASVARMLSAVRPSTGSSCARA